ncbi:hypothetical protein Hanom_Chr03g00235621 [Helianthus anomalus]
MSFVFTPNCRRCPLTQKLTSFVLYVSKSCTVYPLSLTLSDILVKYGYVPCTWGHTCLFTFAEVIL